MATSGSIDYNQTRNEIIQDALALIGVYGVGRTISAEDMKFCSNMLNKMIKTYQADGLHLWAKEEGYLFIATGTGQYTLSADSSSARACLRSDASITELTSDAVSLATLFNVTSTEGMALNDIVGLTADDGSTTWTTISNVASATQFTTFGGISADASAGMNIYSFTSRINKPLRILGMRRVTQGPAAPSSIPMLMLSHQEYFDLPNKTNQGLPTHFYYNPDLTTGNLYMWSVPSDPQMYFEVTFERQLEDFDSATNTPDFPSEWLECLTYQLATRVAPAFGKSNMLQAISPLAEALYEKVSGFDCEAGSISLMPDGYTGR